MDFALEPNRRNVSDDDFLADIRKIAIRLGKDFVTIDEYNKFGSFHSFSIAKRFGGWTTALNRAGLRVVHHNGGIRADDAIRDLKAVANFLNRDTVKQSEYRRHGEYGVNVLVRHFGSWQAALATAGLTPCRTYRLTDKELFQNLECVWRTLGRQPRYGDIEKPLSAYSAGAYERRFGSWRKSLEAFVEFIQSPNENAHSRPETGLVIKTSTESATRRRTSRSIGWRLRFLVMRKDVFKCRLCGASPARNSSVTLQVDHIRAWSNGGETEMENLQTLCETCNLGKSDLSVNESVMSAADAKKLAVARENLGETFAVQAVRAHQMGISAEEADAAVDEAMRDVRPRLE